MQGTKRKGIILSYVLIIFQTISTLVLTNYYLKNLGNDTYGLYQMIYSVAHYILILDLGISTVMIRFITEYNTLKKKRESENFAFHFLIIILLVVGIVWIIGNVINLNIEMIYTNLSSEEYALSHRLFNGMLLQIILTIIGHYFQGIALAYEKFTFVRGMSITQVIVNFVLVVTFISNGKGVLGIVWANTISVFFNVISLIYYDYKKIKFRIKWHYWNLQALKPAFVLMLALLLQSIVGHVNNTVDKTILGIMTTKTDVAVYSIAATFITMFNTLPTAISSVFQPSVTKKVISGADTEELTDEVIKPGRFQFILTGGFIAGFILFGKEFITCWVGENMIKAWEYVILILVPNMIPLIQNVCLSILNAKDKRLFRSFILIIMTGMNIVLTIIFINQIGAIGAPLATGISYFGGHVVVMNLYYEKCIGLNIRRMFSEIFRGISGCILVTFVVSLPLTLWENNGSWLIFGTKALYFCIIYALLLVLRGMNSEEKKIVLKMIDRIKLHISY